jgi:hypothetical protein
MNQKEKLDDEYFEDEQFRRRGVAYHDSKHSLEVLKSYVVTLLVGAAIGVAVACLYIHKAKEEQQDKKDRVAHVDNDISIPVKESHKYFSIEAMVDGVGYDISRPLPPNIVPRVYHVVLRNKTLDGEHLELRRPIEVDAIEDLSGCIKRSMKTDKRTSYNPSEYDALIEKLPSLDAYGEYRTITKPDVMKAYDRARGGLKAIIDE